WRHALIIGKRYRIARVSWPTRIRRPCFLNLLRRQDGSRFFLERKCGECGERLVREPEEEDVLLISNAASTHPPHQRRFHLSSGGMLPISAIFCAQWESR